MQSKEEIERKLEQTEDDEITISLLYQKTELLEEELEQLEKEKQKLIKDLEGAIDFTKTGRDLISKAKVECLENVLKIVKGENDE